MHFPHFLTCHWPDYKSADSHIRYTTGLQHPNKKVFSTVSQMAYWKRKKVGGSGMETEEMLLDLSTKLQG